MPGDTLLNVNLPPIEPDYSDGVKITTLGRRQYKDPVKIEDEGRNGFSFKIGGQGPKWKGENSCDFKAIEENCMSVTPIHLDLTNYDAIDELRSWEL